MYIGILVYVLVYVYWYIGIPSWYSFEKGWLAIAKLKPLSLFISLSLTLKKAFDNVKMEK